MSYGGFEIVSTGPLINSCTLKLRPGLMIKLIIDSQ